MDYFTIFWLISGATLLVSEFIIPGGVVGFLGAAALMVGGARLAGFLESWMGAFTAWFILSLVLLIGVRHFVMSRFFEGESSRQSVDEDLDAHGEVVEVVQTVREFDSEGRIHFRGTSWPASSLKGEIPPGSKASISFRQNLIWVVEPLEILSDEDDTL